MDSHLSLHITAEDVEARLRPLGLTTQMLMKAVRAALGGFQSTTAFHPTFSPGSYAYAEGTAGLRRTVMPSGSWEVDEEDGQPRTYSERFGIVIIVASGDEYTGIDGEKQPTARNPKGTATEKKVAVNQAAGLFPLNWVGIGGRAGADDQDVDESKLITWVLLIHFDLKDGVVRAELSLPRRFKAGKPCEWVERIVLPEIEFGGGDAAEVVRPIGDDAGPAGDTAADIDVAWKQ